MNINLMNKLNNLITVARKPFGSRGLTALMAAVFAAGVSHAQFVPPSPETFDHEGWVFASGVMPMVGGNEATFQQRHQMSSSFAGGVQSLFWESYPTDDLTLVLEARIVAVEEEYFFNFDLKHQDGRFLTFGFEQTRHWYDGSGGYFPATDLWFQLWDNRLHVDRGNFWIEAGIAPPDMPAFTLSYNHFYRRGKKDSTIWGRTGLTGGAGNRAIVPSYRVIDERRHVFEGRGEYTITSTDFGAGVRVELSEQQNVLNIQQFPGQVGTESHVSQSDGVKTDLFSGNAWASSQLSDRIRMSTGYVFLRINNDISGDRLLYDPATGVITSNYTNMDGHTRLTQHVANVNVAVSPSEYLMIIPSFRFEWFEDDNLVTFNTVAPQRVPSTNKTTNLSQRLELRYSGIDRLRLYARGDWMQGNGDLREFATNAEHRVTNFERIRQTYTLGANWNPHHMFTLSSQLSYSIRNNDYDHLLPGRIGRHPAFIQKQDFRTSAFNIRVTTRPVNRVTLVSRYDIQLNRIDTQGSQNVAGQQVPLVMIRSGDMTRHTISQSVTWSPWDQLYLQASGNYVISYINTPANQTPGAAWEGLVLQSRNDYMFSTGTAVYAYSEKTDITIGGTYYRANNYDNNTDRSVAYGVGEEEYGVRVGITHRIHKNLECSGGYGYYNYSEVTTGGNRNYDAHLLYAGLTLRF